MKKSLFAALALTTFTLNAYADNNSNPILNKVTLQLRSEQWLVTKTALVTVMINAAVNEQGVDKIRNDILLKLNQIAKADWHIVGFNRQEDRTGLEGVTIQAQARMVQTDLSRLRNNAKNVSKPGETFTVENVEFTPTEEETRAVKATMRNDIYQQAKREIEVLNNTYSTQRYYLHKIDFVQGPIIMPLATNAYAKTAAAVASAPSSAPLSIGNKAELQATVVLASFPELPSNLPRPH